MEEKEAIKEPSNSDTDLYQTPETAPGCTNTRMELILEKTSNVKAAIAAAEAERAKLIAESKTPDSSEDSIDDGANARRVIAESEALMKDHIVLLQKYNEIRDIGQGLIGMIAEQRSVRIADVMMELGLSEKD